MEQESVSSLTTQAEDGNLAKELKKLNQNIDELRHTGKFMLYSANPFKFAFMNFIAGAFHSLGGLFGYIVIFGAFAFILSKVNLNQLVTNWMENTLGQINWEKVMPSPQLPEGINLNGLDLPIKTR
ncbi:MAG: hypothetical protein ABH867_00315 [Patescibacteria group bacterium]